MRITFLKSKSITFKKSIGYIQQQRRRLSCFKKGVFNTQEGHILER